MADILDTIMARKREEVTAARRLRPESQLLADCRGTPPPRGFARALQERVYAEEPAVIAEVKLASPSKGRIHPAHLPFHPDAIAQGYADNGATCISCLTDRDFFQGDGAFVARIRERVFLPVLRKDFLYDPYQIAESRWLGADAVLLIMAALERNQALELEAAARELGMDVLVEVHDEAELELAHDLVTPLIGINNRNLKTFVTDLATTFRLSRRVEPQRIVVAESGIRDAHDVRALMEHRVFALLIGESFMKEADPGAALGRLLQNHATP
ncbi:MAG: indole-3-glycerol phosphate synthase TrpC [Magnetococcales bacterium]|nr:indole-3-glycerol phosphate synthase TrpC [Magnetococcales bacterium]